VRTKLTTYAGTVDRLSGISFVRTCGGATCNWFPAVTGSCNATRFTGKLQLTLPLPAARTAIPKSSTTCRWRGHERPA